MYSGGLGKGGGKGEKTGHGGWSLVGLVNSMRVTDLFLVLLYVAIQGF